MPDSITLPDVPCEKPFEKRPSKVPQGQRPPRETPRLIALTSSPSVEGFLPRLLESGGYKARIKGGPTIGPPGYALCHHSSLMLFRVGPVSDIFEREHP